MPLRAAGEFQGGPVLAIFQPPSRPLFQRAVDLLLTQSIWKQMVTRAIRGKQNV